MGQPGEQWDGSSVDLMIYVSGYEATSPCLTGTLLDDDGVAINPAAVSSVKFTLYNEVGTRDIINTRNAVEVLSGAIGSTDELTISAGGIFSFVFSTSDMVIVNTAKDQETHVFEFLLSYLDALSRQRKAVIMGEMVVVNRKKVP